MDKIPLYNELLKQEDYVIKQIINYNNNKKLSEITWVKTRTITNIKKRERKNLEDNRHRKSILILNNFFNENPVHWSWWNWI